MTNQKLNAMRTFPRLPGVYGLIEKQDGAVYVGSSKNLHLRISHHFADLQAGRHRTSELQTAFNSSNLSGVCVLILQTFSRPSTDKWKLRDLEAHWIATLGAYTRILNIANIVTFAEKERYAAYRSRSAEQN